MPDLSSSTGWMIEIAKSVPNLVVLVWIVNRFISASGEMIKETKEFQREALERTEEASLRLENVINKNSEVIGRCNGCLERAEAKLATVCK